METIFFLIYLNSINLLYFWLKLYKHCTLLYLLLCFFITDKSFLLSWYNVVFTCIDGFFKTLNYIATHYCCFFCLWRSLYVQHTRKNQFVKICRIDSLIWLWPYATQEDTLWLCGPRYATNTNTNAVTDYYVSYQQWNMYRNK